MYTQKIIEKFTSIYPLLEDFWLWDSHYPRDFLVWPASYINHHAELGGLWLHTLEVIQLIRFCPSHTPETIIAGFWHDMGKIDEFTKDRKNVLPRNAHVQVSADLWMRFVKEMNSMGCNERTVYNHILSHHGKLEWGSVRPIMNSHDVLLHEADMLSCKLDVQRRQFNSLYTKEVENDRCL